MKHLELCVWCPVVLTAGLAVQQPALWSWRILWRLHVGLVSFRDGLVLSSPANQGVCG